jgi:hypothetical protein
MLTQLRSYATNGLWPWIVTILVLLATTFELRNQGRRWWCACGRPNLWTSDAWGPHNSQHLFDTYSFTHVLHGLALYGLLVWLLPRLSFAWRLCLGVFAESLWEMIENTNWVIERYRATTAALGYQGDTVANSLGDILSGAAGFVLARYLGMWRSIFVFAVVEVTLLLWIRDSLILNIIMLIHPSDAIKAWQAH